METIIAALISALASIVVAWIGRSPASTSPDAPQALAVTAPPSPQKFRTAWKIFLALLIPWIVLTPILIGHDFAGFNLFLVAALTILASLLWPIRPLPAAAIILAIHPVNFFMEPLAKIVRHVPYPVSGIENRIVFFLVAFSCSNALIVAALCYWRRRSMGSRTGSPIPTENPSTQPIAVPPQTAHAHPSGVATLTADLNALASLHASGKLTDEEFRRAKERLLGR